MNQIQIISVKEIQNDTPLQAFFSVQLDGLIIHDFRLIRTGSNGRLMVKLPLVTWKGLDGKVNRKELIELPMAVRQSIEIAILAHWKGKRDGKT